MEVNMYGIYPCECGRPAPFDTDLADVVDGFVCECGRVTAAPASWTIVYPEVRTRHAIHLMMGVPGSGKSTLVQALASGDTWDGRHYPVVNPDSIRLACGALYDPKNEPRVWDAARLCVAQFLIQGVPRVYVDATNTRRMHRDRWHRLDDEMANLPDYDVCIYEVLTPEPVCRERRPLLGHVIDRMLAGWEPVTDEELQCRRPGSQPMTVTATLGGTTFRYRRAYVPGPGDATQTP